MVFNCIVVIWKIFAILRVPFLPKRQSKEGILESIEILPYSHFLVFQTAAQEVQLEQRKSLQWQIKWKCEGLSRSSFCDYCQHHIFDTSAFRGLEKWTDTDRQRVLDLIWIRPKMLLKTKWSDKWSRQIRFAREDEWNVWTRFWRRFNLKK